MRVKCLAQEHNTMAPARARTRTARSGVERTNHEATAPPTLGHTLQIILKSSGSVMLFKAFSEALFLQKSQSWESVEFIL